MAARENTNHRMRCRGTVVHLRKRLGGLGVCVCVCARVLKFRAGVRGSNMAWRRDCLRVRAARSRQVRMYHQRCINSAVRVDGNDSLENVVGIPLRCRLRAQGLPTAFSSCSRHAEIKQRALKSTNKHCTQASARIRRVLPLWLLPKSSDRLFRVGLKKMARHG